MQQRSRARGMVLRGYVQMSLVDSRASPARTLQLRGGSASTMFSVESWPQPAARAWVVARRFQKFLVVGAVGLGVNQGMLFLLHQGFGSHLIISSTIAIFTSMIVTFVLNEHWTWHDRGGGPLIHRIAKYFPINLVGLVINVLVLKALVTEANMHYLVANLFGAGAAAIWNFFLNNHFTWGANEE
jgi:putative flippase GtrA